MIGINDLLGGRSVAATADGIASVIGSIRSTSPNTNSSVRPALFGR